MKKTMIAICLLLSNVAVAQNFRCQVVGEPEEYSVELSLDSESESFAAFFDNNSWQYAKLTDIQSLECTDCSTNYAFKGDGMEVQFSLPSSAKTPPIGTLTLSAESEVIKYELVNCSRVDELLSR